MRRYLALAGMFLAIISGTLMIMTASAKAVTAEACVRSSSNVLGFPTWYKYLNPTFVPASGNAPAECKLAIPLNAAGETDFMQAIGPILLAVFEIILRVSGILAIVFVIWGGIQYQLSQGEPERINKARSVIINALIGLALSISATVIVNLIARNIT